MLIYEEEPHIFMHSLIMTAERGLVVVVIQYMAA